MAVHNFDSGHVIVPVAHPSGEVHEIAVPEGTDVGEFHEALGDAGYHHDFPQPTREGAIELSSAFREAARKAAMKAVTAEVKLRSGSGEGGEAGFTVGRDGTISRVDFQSDQSSAASGHLRQRINPGSDLGALHTHDSRHSDKPSGDDIENAKKSHSTIWVASASGLHSVDPDGKSQQIFKSPTWYSDKEPK